MSEPASIKPASFPPWAAADATNFRNAMHFVMGMGMPVDAAAQVAFHWHAVTSTTAAKDSLGVPFSPTATVTTTPSVALRVPYFVEWIEVAGTTTRLGVVVPARVRVWLLDDDYDDVKTADYLVIDGEKYLRHLEEPSYAIFDVGVHCITFIAENER